MTWVIAVLWNMTSHLFSNPVYTLWPWTCDSRSSFSGWSLPGFAFSRIWPTASAISKGCKVSRTEIFEKAWAPHIKQNFDTQNWSPRSSKFGLFEIWTFCALDRFQRRWLWRKRKWRPVLCPEVRVQQDRRGVLRLAPGSSGPDSRISRMSWWRLPIFEWWSGQGSGSGSLRSWCSGFKGYWGLYIGAAELSSKLKIWILEDTWTWNEQGKSIIILVESKSKLVCLHYSHILETFFVLT